MAVARRISLLAGALLAFALPDLAPAQPRSTFSESPASATSSASAAPAAAPAASVKSEDVAPPSEDLLRLSVSVVEELRSSLSALGERATARGVRSEAKEWSEDLPREMSENLAKPDPMAAFMDGWALAEQALVHLEGPGGERDFGAERTAAARAVRAARDRLVAFAEEHLATETVRAIESRVHDFALENPYKGRPSWFRRLTGFRPADFTLVRMGQDTVVTLADIPLAPGRTARGFERGAEGLRGISSSADRFTEEVRRLPTRIREELDFALARIDSSTTLTATLERAREITENVRATSEAAPEAAREARETLERAESAAREISGAATAAGSAAAEADRLVASVDGLVRTLDERTRAGSKAASKESAGAKADGAQDAVAPPPPLEAERIADAAGALQESAIEIRMLVESISDLVEKLRENDGPAPTGGASDGTDGEAESRKRGFDPLEVEAAAHAMQGAAVELRGTIAETRALLESEAPTARMDEIEARMNRTMDRLLARAVILAVAIFGLAVAFVVVRRRLARRE